jgi:nicotinate-nucleotide pyrophosphorylase (carboxylating)
MMKWLDEGALFSNIAMFLNEDLGRGDITTQATVLRQQTAKGRFLAKEKMIVCGLEAAEAVFNTLDAEQQIEAFVSDGDEVEAGKVIARLQGFADALLAGERTALNLLQRLSGIATLTRQYVRAIEGTRAVIVDTRKTTPGLRILGQHYRRLNIRVFVCRMKISASLLFHVRQIAPEFFRDVRHERMKQAQCLFQDGN